MHGQMHIIEDTVTIAEVIISGRAPGEEFPGFKKTTVDSSVMKSFSLGSVAEVLTINPSVFIKNYGAGGSATPSFRGTGASQTQVTWNGIRIDHPMLGQSDLSLLPAGLTDELTVLFGGASLALNSGAAGGTISMDNNPVWGRKTSLIINPGAGSFGSYSGLVSARTGTDSFHSVTRAFFQSAENDFPYINRVSAAEPYRDIRKNSQAIHKGIMQELYFRKSFRVLSARLWYQEASRNLPASIITSSAGQGESQDDESVRIMVNYESGKGAGSYFITGAWMMNKLNYFNNTASIDSRNYSETWILKSGFLGNLGNFASYKLFVNEEFTTVTSVNYEDRANRNSADIAASFSTTLPGKLNGSLLLREILHRNELLAPDFATGLQFRVTESEDYLINANVSRTSRVPGLNDLFWYPGGNPALNNEYAYIYELGFEISQGLTAASRFNCDVTLFRNSIKDMIQWQPGEFSYWTAGNIRNVSTRGVETAASFLYRQGRLSGIFNAAYSYTKATDESPGIRDEFKNKQLIYVPENQANASIKMKYGKVYASWRANYTGKRYSPSLMPSFLVNCLSTGLQLEPAWGLMDINFEIDNIFNAEYQSIAHYPLPGRTFGAKLLIKINN